jgi:hypothetical protein
VAGDGLRVDANEEPRDSHGLPEPGGTLTRQRRLQEPKSRELGGPPADLMHPEVITMEVITHVGVAQQEICAGPAHARVSRQPA